MSAVDAVRQLQKDHNDLLEKYNLARAADVRHLVEENISLKRLVRDVTFLAQSYDTPELNSSCRNHVELVQHLNETLGRLTVDMSL